MGTEYPPKAITGIYTALHAILSWVQNGGTVGDRKHGTGYHRAFNRLPASDYSKQAARDTHGYDPDAASAQDLTPKTREQQVILSRRLMTACLDPKDTRPDRCIREWFGSTDGRTVTGYSPYRGRKVSADSSHLWHVHLSVWRDMWDNPGDLQQIVEVLAGVTWQDSRYNPANKVPTTPPGVTPPVVKPPITSSYPTPSGRVIYLDKVKPGQKDSDSVYWVQIGLGRFVAAQGVGVLVVPTGTYDTATVSAAKAFQHHLGDDETDGALGPKQVTRLVLDTKLNVTIENES